LTGSLADRLALALLDHGELPCERVARVVGARTSEVRRLLRDDPRIVRVGAGRSSRWRLVLPSDDAARNGSGRIRDGSGRNLSVRPMVTDGPNLAARLEAVERRLDAVERRLAAEVHAA
jgi:hypothetical protein